MKLTTKKQILTEKIGMVTVWINRLTEEFKANERDLNDYLYELGKKQAILESAVKELQTHMVWLDSID